MVKQKFLIGNEHDFWIVGRGTRKRFTITYSNCYIIEWTKSDIKTSCLQRISRLLSETFHLDARSVYFKAYLVDVPRFEEWKRQDEKGS